MKLVTGFLIVQVLIVLIEYSEGGDVLGVDCDGCLKTWDTKDEKWGSKTCPSGGVRLQSISKGHGSSLLGVGTDNSVYTKESADRGEWEGPISGSCCISTVAVLPNGYIIAISKLGKMVINLGTAEYYHWSAVQGSSGLKSVTVLDDGGLLAISKSGSLKKKNDWNSKWKNVKLSCSKVTSLAEQDDGSLIGVTKDNTLAVPDKTGKKFAEIPNSDCVISVISKGHLAAPEEE
ncbi:uncharacterized protein LOC144452799 [Glandiceps talaboti]